jgi:hypothetical protein
MTVLSFQWLLARPRLLSRPRLLAWPRRSAAVIRSLSPKRAPAPPGRRTYADSFFADPNAVEDDSRRMRPQAIWK